MSGENLYSTFHRAAERHPEGDAVVHGDRTLTYAELDDLSRRVAAGLAHLGVQVGDRVLVYAPNSPEILAIYYACAYLGAIFAPVNPSFRTSEMSYIAKNAEARVAIVHAERLEYMQSIDDATIASTLVVMAGDDRAGEHVAFEDLLVERPVPHQAEVAEDMPVLICYTSGTTSTPKPVLLSHLNEVYSARAYADIWDLGPGDRAVVSMPLAWAYGLSTTSMSLLSAGSTVLLLSRFHPVEVLEEIERRRATIFFGTMSMYSKMLDVLGRKTFDLSSLRMCMNGGEACPDEAVRAFAALTGLTPIQAYAASEAKPLIAVRAGDASPPFNTSGQLVPGAKIRLLTDTGASAALGEPGEADVWCPGLMLGYHREPEMTAEKLTEDGWLKTGDLVVEDDRGYFRVVGRRSEMIIRSGANIAPAEVESALVGHPDVAAAGVVGLPDPLSGEAVIAMIIPATPDGVDPADLRAHLEDRLAPYKLPSRILVTDALPSTANGKVDRHALRQRALALVGAAR